MCNIIAYSLSFALQHLVNILHCIRIFLTYCTYCIVNPCKYPRKALQAYSPDKCSTRGPSVPDLSVRVPNLCLMLVMDSRTAYSRLVWLTPFSCRPVAQQFEMHLRARPLRTGSGRDDAGRPECGREPAFLSFLQFPPLTGLGYCRLASRRNAALAACARTALLSRERGRRVGRES